MKVKLIAVLIAISAIFIGAVLWRTDRFVYSDRLSWVEAQNRAQLGSMNHALTVELKSLQRVMSIFSSDNFKKESFNWSAINPFYVAASFVKNGSTYEMQTLLIKDKSKAASWNKDFVKAALGEIDGKSKDTRFFVSPFQDNKRGRYVGVVFIDGMKAYALIGNGETFQSLIDSQKGSLSTFSIVNSKSLVVGHSITEYLGTVMRDNPFLSEALTNASSHGSGVHKLSNKQEVYGMFEQIPNSNLVIISSAPMKEMMQGRRTLWWQFLLLGCGLVLVGSAGILRVISLTENQIEELEDKMLSVNKNSIPNKILPNKMASQAFKNQPPNSKLNLSSQDTDKTVISDLSTVQADIVKTSVRVASALAHEMRGPLTSILGYSQMIIASNPDQEIIKSVDSILRESRSARSVVDKILGYAGEDLKEKNATKLDGPMARALKNLDALFSRKGVRIFKSLESTTSIDMHLVALSNAFENILTNSVEAMERMAKKEIHIDMVEEDKVVRVFIEDTGEGIEAETLTKICDPFFTTRAFQNHMGLGLSVAYGVLREHSAEMKFNSVRGRGTKVEIIFNKSEAGSPSMVALDSDNKVIAMEEKNDVKGDEKTVIDEAFAETIIVDRKKALSPELDVNIDRLFELPSDQELKMMVSESEVPKLEPEVKPNQINIESDPVIKSTFDKVSKLDSYPVGIRRPGKRI
jgi:signal transduction histidine kinase